MKLLPVLNIEYFPMRSNTELQKKLRGFHAIPRDIISLLQKKILTKEEYFLYTSSLSYADWDEEKPSTYGSSDLTQTEIERLFGFSKGYVSKFSKGLFQKRFWQKQVDKRIKIIGFELTKQTILVKILQTETIIDVCKFIADKQIQIADQQQAFAKQQQNSSKENEVSQPQIVAKQQLSPAITVVVSCKNSSSNLKSDEEYIAINETGIFSTFEIENMKWIDLNVHETPNVRS